MAAKTTSNATADGISIFQGLKPPSARAAGATGTVTGARREVAAGYCCAGGCSAEGYSCLGLTTVTSSLSLLVVETAGDSLVVALFEGCAIGTGTIIPDAIVKSSINSETFW